MKTYRVSHILVTHKYEAEDLLLKIKEGSSFSELATKFSTCPSRERGGDLGPISFGKADPDFEDEALKLKIGEASGQPVRTKFGYHLILRLE
ncbi:MAG: peptidylprolyl isomerase [Bdellovibrionota bacterium]